MALITIVLGVITRIFAGKTLARKIRLSSHSRKAGLAELFSFSHGENGIKTAKSLAADNDVATRVHQFIRMHVLIRPGWNLWAGEQRDGVVNIECPPIFRIPNILLNIDVISNRLIVAHYQCVWPPVQWPGCDGRSWQFGWSHTLQLSPPKL